MTEEQRLELILEAVKYCNKVKALGMPVSAYSKALREPIHFLWELRNGNKLHAAQYRSTKSLNLIFGKGELRYDHAIPFKYTQNELLKIESPTVSDVREILEKLLIVCVITLEEDQRLTSLGLSGKMPANWDQEDSLARYKFANIEIVKNI